MKDNNNHNLVPYFNNVPEITDKNRNTVLGIVIANCIKDVLIEIIDCAFDYAKG